MVKEMPAEGEGASVSRPAYRAGCLGRSFVKPEFVRGKADIGVGAGLRDERRRGG
jgi:hypothetical protein